MKNPKRKKQNFDFKVADPADEDSFPLTTIDTIIAEKSSAKVSVCGRVSFQEKGETVMTKGKTLKKQEALITDNSSSIRLVLWEDDIKKFVSGSCMLPSC